MMGKRYELRGEDPAEIGYKAPSVQAIVSLLRKDARLLRTAWKAPPIDLLIFEDELQRALIQLESFFLVPFFLIS